LKGAPVETAKAAHEFIKLAQKQPFSPAQFYRGRQWQT
jgi:hypothetical protein